MSLLLSLDFLSGFFASKWIEIKVICCLRKSSLNVDEMTIPKPFLFSKQSGYNVLPFGASIAQMNELKLHSIAIMLGHEMDRPLK